MYDISVSGDHMFCVFDGGAYVGIVCFVVESGAFGVGGLLESLQIPDETSARIVFSIDELRLTGGSVNFGPLLSSRVSCLVSIAFEKLIKAGENLGPLLGCNESPEFLEFVAVEERVYFDISAVCGCQKPGEILSR